MDLSKKVSRRGFFKGVATIFAVAPFLNIFKSVEAAGCGAAPAGVKAVDEADATAKRLEYVMTASDSKNKLFKAGQNCENCKFYKADKANAGWAPCTMMGNKFVAGCGWCKSYKAK